MEHNTKVVIHEPMTYIAIFHQLIEERKYDEALEKLENHEKMAEGNKCSSDVFETIDYYRLYISILKNKETKNVAEILKSLEALEALSPSCASDTMYYTYLLAFAYDLPSDKKQLADQIAAAPYNDQRILFLTQNDEIRMNTIKREFRAARDTMRRKIKVVIAKNKTPAVKNLVLKELLERVVDAETNSDEKIKKQINGHKYSDAYRHLRKKAKNRIISEEEKAILHLLEAIMALQTFGISTPTSIANNEFARAQEILKGRKNKSGRIESISTLVNAILTDNEAQVIENPIPNIISVITVMVGETYNEVCMRIETNSISLNAALEQLKIKPEIASYIRLYRAYELFNGPLTTSTEDPRELCKNEIASSDDVIVNIIAKYFIERFNNDPPKIGYGSLTKKPQETTN